MAQQLEQCVIRILNVDGAVVGAGFVVADRLAVTCAHVVQTAGGDRGQSISFQFYSSTVPQRAQVLVEGWSPFEGVEDANDVAFLLLEPLLEEVMPAVLGTAKGRSRHPYTALGFPSLARYQHRWADGHLSGTVPVQRSRPTLQFEGGKIKEGMSGAPVLDLETDRVVGMVCEFKDDAGERFAWAVTSDTLVALNPALRLWPDAYGPKELDAYLESLINDNQTLTLPDGSEVLLERIYVSLRADEMNITEREAEYALYQEDVAELKRMVEGSAPDQYIEFATIRKVIARNPKMLMLEARNWKEFFGERERNSMSLAEVVQKHSRVVLLGDPGSGKTTLGRWLVLQFARALRRGAAHVQVRADMVRPGAKAEQPIDLGPVRLPIFIRISDFARTRWQNNSHLSLENFICRQQPMMNLPSRLTLEAISALIEDFLTTGRALIVLDGLDEVNDPIQRRTVMEAVKSFIQPQHSFSLKSELRYNQLLLTSRIVGYQFQPLTDLPHYTIEDMGETAITAFCHAWLQHIARIDIAKAEEQAHKLKDAIFDHAHPGVRALAGNPLLLTILAHVYQASSQRILPSKRVTLFEEASHALYNQREDFWKKTGITFSLLTQALGVVAAYIHTQNITGFAEEGEVRKQLATVLSEFEQIEAVLTAARDVSGFLVARGEGVYGFLHRALQEYFAAEFLVSQADRTIKHISSKLLDSIWREPIVLALGIVSRPKYPDSRHYLPNLFTLVLNTPDPIGDFLPRRELLAAAACAECERVPEGTGIQIVRRLLAVLTQREGLDHSPVLLSRVERAIATLLNSPAKDEVEIQLCNNIQNPNYELRYAALKLIGEMKWSSPNIVKTLIKTWKIYPGPAASLLSTLNGIYDTQPTHFQSDFLPMRKALESESLLWEKIKGSLEWQVAISALYLPSYASFSYDWINRDSPLTQLLLAALREPSDSISLSMLHQELLSSVRLLNTAEARDAALILSALGDTSWISLYLENSGSNSEWLRALLICFASILSRNAIITVQCSDMLYEALGDMRETALCYARAYILTLEYNLDHFPDTQHFSHNLYLNYEVDEYDVIALTSTLRKALNDTITLNPSEIQRMNKDPNMNFFRSLIQVLSFARKTELYGSHSLSNYDLDTPFELAHQIKRLFGYKRIQSNTDVHGIDPDLALFRQLSEALGEVLDYSYNIELTFNRSSLRELDLVHESNLLLDIEGDMLSILEGQTFFDSDMRTAVSFNTMVNRTVEHIDKMDRYVHFVRRSPSYDIEFAGEFDLIAFRLQAVRNRIDIFQKMASTWKTLAKTYRQQLKVYKRQQHSRSKKLTDSTKSDLTSININDLSSLVAKLTSYDDMVREQARTELVTVRKASNIGREIIEQIAELAQFYTFYPQISSQMDWALKEIIYDVPSWVTQWIEQASRPERSILVKGLLRRMHKVTYDVFITILRILQDIASRPQIQLPLLNALSWQARKGQIPGGKLFSIQQQLLLWLDEETEPKTRSAIIKVLGYMQDPWGDIRYALLNQLQHPKSISDLPALFMALACLATSNPTLSKVIWETLYSAQSQPEASAALIRLSLMKDSILGRKQAISNLLDLLDRALVDPSLCLNKLLEAGTDDNVWDDQYHGILASIVRIHLERHNTLLPELLVKLQRSIIDCEWPSRRIILAAVAACIEVMPTAVQRACPTDLEALLVKGAIDAESSTSRRIALNALSYLRSITPAVVPALLSGCQDSRGVQRDAIVAASRFHRVSGYLEPSLIKALTGKSVSTAYTVAQLLGALGTTLANEEINLRMQITEALINALKDPRSQREVMVSDKSKGKLEDALYTSLLQVTGWTL